MPQVSCNFLLQYWHGFFFFRRCLGAISFSFFFLSLFSFPVASTERLPNVLPTFAEDRVFLRLDLEAPCAAAMGRRGPISHARVGLLGPRSMGTPMKCELFFLGHAPKLPFNKIVTRGESSAVPSTGTEEPQASRA